MLTIFRQDFLTRPGNGRELVAIDDEVFDQQEAEADPVPDERDQRVSGDEPQQRNTIRSEHALAEILAEGKSFDVLHDDALQPFQRFQVGRFGLQRKYVGGCLQIAYPPIAEGYVSSFRRAANLWLQCLHTCCR